MRIARKLVTLMIATGLLTLGQSTARAEHEDAELSKAAMQAIQKLVPGGKVQETEPEVLLVRVYEVEVKTGNREVDVCVLEDGSVLSVEEKVEPSQLPQAVANKIAELIKGGKLLELEKIEQHGELKLVPLAEPRIQYEFDAKVNGKKHEFRLTTDGKLVEHPLGLADEQDHAKRGDDDDDDDHKYHGRRGDDDDDEHEADDDKDDDD